MANEIPLKMRKAVSVRSLSGKGDGHFYVNQKSIDVYALSMAFGVGGVRITRKQLEAALALMNKARK